MSDLFESQVQVEVEKRLSDIVRSDPKMVIEAYEKENTRLKSELIEVQSELAETKYKWAKFLDSEGYMDVSEVAERIKVPYIDPSGKRQFMGRSHFCQLLRLDRILLHKSTGYGLYADCNKTIKENSKVVTNDHNGHIKSSVKFNSRALEYLDDKYSNDDRVWHSTSNRDLYYE